ncbi:MAG: PAS domain S-box protein [Candidatus Didemnitutus sp.]|nr:PAS domain S-box protein [Candidatus Didemnitutus sp.]
MKIATKFFLAVCGIAALFLTTAWLDYRAATALHDRLLVQRQHHFSELSRVREMSNSLTSLQSLLRRTPTRDTPDSWAVHLKIANELRHRFQLALANTAREESPARLAALSALRNEVQAFDHLWADYTQLGGGLSPQVHAYAERMLVPHLSGEMTAAIENLSRTFYAALEADYDAGLADFARARQRTMLTSAVFVLLLIVGAVVLHRDIVQPLRAMELDARKVRQGVRSGARFHYVRNDELGAVGRAFNDALDTLQSSAFSIEQLELKVREHSAEAARGEAQLRSVSDNFPAGALYQFVQHEDGMAEFAFLGGGFRTIFGVEPTEILADSTWLDRQILPEDFPAMEEAGKLARANETPFHHEARILTADGRIKWLSFRSQPRREANGDLVWDGVISDITQQKEFAAAVSQQVAFFTALNETTLDLLNRREKSALLQAIAERTSILLDTPHVELSLIEGDDLVTSAYFGPPPSLLGNRGNRTVSVISWRAVDLREPVIVENYSTLPEARPTYTALAPRAAAIFPILHRDECLGIFGLIRKEPGHIFSRSDIQKGQLIAQLAALVLHNSAIYDDAVHVAEARMQELKESEHRLRTAQNLAHVGHWEFLFTTGKRSERWSDETYRIFGLEPQAEPIDRARFESLIHPDDIPHFRQVVDEAFSQRARFSLSYRVVRPDGSVREIRDQGEPKHDAAGHIVGMHGVLQDVTERTIAESALRESEERNRQIIDTALDAVITLDATGLIGGWNPQAEAIFGWNSPQALGQRVTDLILPARPNWQNNQTLARLFTHQENALFNRRVDLMALHRDGHEFPIEFTITPVTINGRPHFSAFLRDLTAQRKAESHLRQSQKIESLGTLAGGIAHDFNNLLTGMLGFIELAQMEVAKSHPAREWLDNIATASMRARNLVQQILTFSRQNEGERTAVSPCAVTDEALRLLRSTLPPMVRIEQIFAAECPAVLADSTQLHQLIMNLGTNAWQALPSSGGVITVRVEPAFVTDAMQAAQPDLPRGPVVRLSVTDDGCGMNDATLERMFDPFFTTKPAGKGTGLGLAVVHGIVRSHGGAIIARSAVGEGTTIEIYLPTLETNLPHANTEHELIRGNGERILFVDDENVGRAAIASLLEHLGYRVEHFDHPEVALTRFAECPTEYDLVLTDFAMPGLTGAEFGRRVRLLRPAMPVLVISGFIDQARQIELEECGINTVLRKPPTVEELAHAVATSMRA